MEEKKGIVIAGSLIADIFYQIDTYPNQGFLTNIRSTSLNIGGSGNMILGCMMEKFIKLFSSQNIAPENEAVLQFLLR